MRLPWGPRRTCDFCSQPFRADRDACPGCGYPVSGSFDDWTPPAGAKGRPRRGARTAECPHCGERFPAGRPACPHCGSDAATGWKPGDEVEYQSLDVPDAFDEDDYRRTVSEAGPGRRAVRPPGPSFWTTRRARLLVVGVLLVLAMVVPALVALWRMR